MEKDEVTLPVEMGKLEIVPTKFVITNNVVNPFLTLSQRRNWSKRGIIHNRCSCINLKKVHKNLTTRKKGKKKILKEPVLNLLQTKIKHILNSSNDNETITISLDKECDCSCSISHNNNLENLNLCTLVDNCNQLKISSDNNECERTTIDSEKNKWWNKQLPCKVHSATDKNKASPSCSQQALNPPCDVTIDELASYFETLVHIPKKMSSMAEMMYI